MPQAEDFTENHMCLCQGPGARAPSPPTRRLWFSQQDLFSCSLGGCQDYGFVTQGIACGKLQKFQVN